VARIRGPAAAASGEKESKCEQNGTNNQREHAASILHHQTRDLELIAPMATPIIPI
jgi:hypothetical protein